MYIVETTPKEYDRLFGVNNLCYHTAAFNVLNRDKCDDLLCLLFQDTKIRLGLVVGLKNKQLLSPFSAPFGGFSVLDKRIAIEHIEHAVDSLVQFGRSRGLKNMHLTLPPPLYGETFLTKVQHVLFQKGFHLEAMDLNYVFHLKQMAPDKHMTDVLARNARKNLNIAFSRNFSFQVGAGDDDLMKAYTIIRQNRESKGFHLSMSAAELQKTSKLVKVDSFLVNLEGKEAASAIVYHVTSDVLQVIYWGDLPEFASNKSMNYLTYKVFEYYFQNGYEKLDVGTSMFNGKPNYGLCDFKESIGCSIQPKCEFSIRFPV